MPIFRYIIILQFCCCGIVTADGSVHSAHQQTVVQWEQKIKNIDPKSRKSEKYVPGLIRLLQDEHVPQGLRQQAALTLGRMQEKATDAIPLMLQLLSKAEDEQVRIGLLKALALYGQHAKPATSVAVLIVRDDFATVTERRAAIALLSYIGVADQRAILALNNSLQIYATKTNHLSLADAALLRETAAEAIAYVGVYSKSAIPFLNRLLHDDDEGVRRKVVTALGAIGPASEVTFSGLLELMADDDSAAVRDEAMHTIAKIGPALLPSLKQLLKEKETPLRRRVVISICEMGTDAKQLLPDLTKMLQDEDAEIRIVCAKWIWLISKKADLIIPTSLQLLEHKDRPIRKLAAQLLIDLGKASAPAIPHLKKLKQHKRVEFRQVASYVLRKIKLSNTVPH